MGVRYRMFRPQIQKTYVLVLLALLCLTCVFIASTSFVEIDSNKDVSQDYKHLAANSMKEFLEILKDSSPALDSIYTVNDYIDPNNTGLIFETKPSDVKNIIDIQMSESKKLFSSIKKNLGFEIVKDALIFRNYKKYNLNQSRHLILDDGRTNTFLDSINSYHFMTGEGFLSSKQTVLKPNFAALLVNLFLEADVKSGDTIAVAMTGSMPGANIALHAACVAMNLTPIIISSVGSSDYGAVHPEFTWLDMEKELFDRGVIATKSVAVSLGGRGDLFKTRWGDNGTIYAGQLGREIAQNALDRNYDKDSHIIPPSKGNLTKSIKSRVYKYESILPISKYSAYINIGGGVASMGIGGNEKVGDVGLVDLGDAIETLDDKSVAIEFAKKDIPIISIHTIQDLVKDINGNYLIQYGGKERFDVGKGPLFGYRYNLTITWIALLISFLSVAFVGIYSFKKIKEHMESYEPESIL